MTDEPNKCLLCGQLVYGLCPGINTIPGVVCQNYSNMMQQRIYDWVVAQSRALEPKP